jgi:GTP1/Obg family GTP-binding protein
MGEDWFNGLIDVEKTREEIAEMKERREYSLQGMQSLLESAYTQLQDLRQFLQTHGVMKKSIFGRLSTIIEDIQESLEQEKHDSAYLAGLEKRLAQEVRAEDGDSPRAKRGKCTTSVP